MRKSYKIIHALVSNLLRFVFRIHVSGLENEPTSGPILLCANHISLLDPICICVVLQKIEPYYMAKKSLFKIPVVNLLLKAFNAYPVNRGACDIGAIHKAIDILKDGNCVGIFPQGTRCRDVELEKTEFKNGAALICTKASAPVLPVRICIKKNHWRPFRRIDIVIGKAITTEEFAFVDKKSGELDRISNMIFERICELEPKEHKK